MKFKALPILLVAAALACSTLKTSADYDPKADFTQYKTWAWKDDRPQELARVKRIQARSRASSPRGA